jgi:CheY-like chemotaxis protein
LAESKTVILCVDDEPNALMLRKSVLQRAGYEVLTADSAEQAMAALTSRKIDLVLSDHVMPDKSGAELAQQIKRRWRDLPVILLSGVNEMPSEASAADLFISKAEGPAALCERIQDILSRRRSC